MTNNDNQDIKTMHLSDQALGAVMMALQKSLLEQSDIVPVLKEFKLAEDASGDLVVLNPPLFKVSHDDLDVLTDMSDAED
tara:strand:- start:226 stop:465 length:240 start_codon:yes stop_codon:yes gene_type:complete